MKLLKIMHVVPTYAPAWRYGGPIRSVHGLCRGLAARGNDVHVYTTNVDGPQNLDVPLEQPVHLDGVKVRYFPSRWLRRLYWSPAMDRMIQSSIGEFDIVHLHSVFLWPTWAAARAAEGAGVPYVVTPRGALVRQLVQHKSKWIKKVWIRLIERHTLEHAAAIHVTSEIEAQELGYFGIKAPPIEIAPNAIEELEPETTELPLLSEPQRRVPDEPYILFMGRISWEKGLDRLILAMMHLPDLKLVIAGRDETGYREKLGDMARHWNLADRISYIGHVYGKDKRRLLEQAMLLVLPSYSENFGNAVLEAMQAGCPVVVTPEVGLAPVVQRSGAGLVVAGEPESLAQAIGRIRGEPDLRHQMGSAGRRTVTEQFTWAAVAEQMEVLYRSIISTSGR